MQDVLLKIDELSAWVGKIFAWLILVLTLAIAYEIFVRRVFNSPTGWAFDASYILYGTLFLMSGAYTLSRNGHVRGDFLYRKMDPRRQAMLDLVLYFLFYMPAILAMIYSGWSFFLLSYGMNEHSSYSPAGPPIWPFKGLIPLAGIVMFLQGFAEIVRCIRCIHDGDWPQRLHDVEEMEKIILEQAEAAKQATSAR
jgi:TRAP-type mannitol/chloroaromatic compound transport system permease small subunit